MDNMGPIDASERLAEIQSVAMGTGSMAKKTADAKYRELIEMASGGEKIKQPNPSPGMLAMMGITVEPQPRKKSDG